MKKENIKYFYRIEITTWQEKQGSEEWLTYAREFNSADLLASQQQALAAWNRQMKAVIIYISIISTQRRLKWI